MKIINDFHKKFFDENKVMETLTEDWIKEIISFVTDVESIRSLRLVSKLFYRLVTKCYSVTYEKFILRSVKEQHKLIVCPNFDGMHEVLIKLHMQGYDLYLKNETNTTLERMGYNDHLRPHTFPIGKIFYRKMFSPKHIIRTQGNTIVIVNKISKKYRDPKFLQEAYKDNCSLKILPFLQCGDRMPSMKVNIYNVKRMDEARDHISKTYETVHGFTEYYLYFEYTPLYSIPNDIRTILSDIFRVRTGKSRILVHFYICNNSSNIIRARIRAYQFFGKIELCNKSINDELFYRICSIKKAKEIVLNEQNVYEH